MYISSYQLLTITSSIKAAAWQLIASGVSLILLLNILVMFVARGRSVRMNELSFDPVRCRMAESLYRHSQDSHLSLSSDDYR